MGGEDFRIMAFSRHRIPPPKVDRRNCKEVNQGCERVTFFPHLRISGVDPNSSSSRK